MFGNSRRASTGEGDESADGQSQLDDANSASAGASSVKQRKSTAPVWQFFSRTEQKDSQCNLCWAAMSEKDQLRPYTERLGASKGAGKWGLLPKMVPTNLVSHMMRKHPDDWKGLDAGQQRLEMGPDGKVVTGTVRTRRMC